MRTLPLQPGWLSSSHALTRPGAVGLQFEVPDENARLHLADELATGVVGAGHAFGVLEVVHGDESIFQILERHVKKRIKTVFLKVDQEGDIRRDRVAALAAGRGVQVTFQQRFQLRHRIEDADAGNGRRGAT